MSGRTQPHLEQEIDHYTQHHVAHRSSVRNNKLGFVYMKAVINSKRKLALPSIIPYFSGYWELRIISRKC